MIMNISYFPLPLSSADNIPGVAPGLIIFKYWQWKWQWYVCIQIFKYLIKILIMIMNISYSHPRAIFRVMHQDRLLLFQFSELCDLLHFRGEIQTHLLQSESIFKTRLSTHFNRNWEKVVISTFFLAPLLCPGQKEPSSSIRIEVLVFSNFPTCPHLCP